jgi:hypothetical protein
MVLYASHVKGLLSLDDLKDDFHGLSKFIWKSTDVITRDNDRAKEAKKRN